MRNMKVGWCASTQVLIICVFRRCADQIQHLFIHWTTAHEPPNLISLQNCKAFHAIRQNCCSYPCLFLCAKSHCKHAKFKHGGWIPHSVRCFELRMILISLVFHSENPNKLKFSGLVSTAMNGYTHIDNPP